MAETRYASRFRRVVARLRARGFDVVEEPGCYSRTVGSKDLLAVRSHLVHHTAGGNDASDRRVVRDGRPGLRGPLAQWLTERDGTLRLLSSGYANHAGPTSRRDEGNSYSTGNEIVSAGLRSSDFNPAQVTASEALAEEMAREFAYGVDAWTVGHKEAGVPRGRKVDPAFSMKAFRARLSRSPAIPAVPLPTPNDTPEDDMAQVPQAEWERVRDRVDHLFTSTDKTVRQTAIAAEAARDASEETRTRAGWILDHVKQIPDVLTRLGWVVQATKGGPAALAQLQESLKAVDGLEATIEAAVRRTVTDEDTVHAVVNAVAADLLSRTGTVPVQPQPATPALADKGSAAVTR